MALCLLHKASTSASWNTFYAVTGFSLKLFEGITHSCHIWMGGCHIWPQAQCCHWPVWPGRNRRNLLHCQREKHLLAGHLVCWAVQKVASFRQFFWKIKSNSRTQKRGKIELELISKKNSIVYQVWTHPLVYISLSIFGENSVLRFAAFSALNTAIMFILFRFQTQFFILFLRPVLLFSIRSLLQLENVHLRGWLDLLFPLGNNRCHGV